MNPLIQRLRAEIASDLRSFEARVDELSVLPPFKGAPGPLARAAIALHHSYGAIESALVRLAKVLEGSVPDGADWHQALLSEMGFEVEGVRPAVLSAATLSHLRRLLGFRHFFRHAYGVELDPERVEELRTVTIAVRPHVRDDFQRLDDLLRALAESSS